jgi:hypothetical protein
MSRRVLWFGAGAGVLAPPLLVVALVVATVAEWSFLRAIGWSALERSAVEWPSVLALGRVAWLVVAAFVACGALGLAFAVALACELPTRAARVGAGFLGLVSTTLVVVALRADRPDAPPSWHGRIHNDVYPLIPAASVAAAALLAYGLWRVSAWRGQARLALAALLVIVPALALTNVSPVAQLARYFLFGALLLWLEGLAVALSRVARRPG